MARPEDPKTIYLDSSAIISAIKSEPGHEPVTRVLEAAEARRLSLITSTVLLVEVRGSGLGGAAHGEQEAQILARLDSPQVLLVELDRTVALKARRLAQQLGLKNYDAIHLASAIIGGADVIMAFDSDFPFGRQIEGLWVDRPYAPGGPDLFNPGP